MTDEMIKTSKVLNKKIRGLIVETGNIQCGIVAIVGILINSAIDGGQEKDNFLQEMSNCWDLVEVNKNAPE